MANVDFLKESYLNSLEERKKELRLSIEKLQDEERRDEANLDKIRLNVVDIFSKMFNLSKSDDPKILKEKYLGYFEKITSPWYDNREKALRFGKEKEAIIEEIKIKEVEELKDRFNSCYSSMNNE